ncbi:MliC family protein [Paracoccus alkenifer]|uniref:Membrane-bound inhibitor of C-type lysozyme n=1 Tax=Paracoccus alkenifer TaxID=65735 RepID=A0A1H6MMK7_9RHOB|nr:MliC family protein [Paracoccus alkenifer]SEH98874.1 Membrane-bound inhibitor of C-type lysozyme [Paracoccus alkenifer]
MRLVTVLSATLLLAAPVLAQTPAQAPAPPDAAPVQSAVPAAKPAVPPMSEPAPRPETMDQDSVDDISYACDGDASLQVVFINTASGNSYAIVQGDDRMIPMQVAVSASGARYLSADGGFQLWTKGDSADLVALDGDAETPLRSGCNVAG